MFVGNYWVKDRILNVCLHACRISSLKFFRFGFWYKEMDRMLYLCDGNWGKQKAVPLDSLVTSLLVAAL